MKEKEYEVYYRERFNKNGTEFCCTVTCKNKIDARKNFEIWDNQNKDWTITRILKVW